MAFVLLQTYADLVGFCFFFFFSFVPRGLAHTLLIQNLQLPSWSHSLFTSHSAPQGALGEQVPFKQRWQFPSHPAVFRHPSPHKSEGEHSPSLHNPQLVNVPLHPKLDVHFMPQAAVHTPPPPGNLPKQTVQLP